MSTFAFSVTVCGTNAEKQEVELAEIGISIDEYDTDTVEDAEKEILKKIGETKITEYYTTRYKVTNVVAKPQFEKLII